MSKTEKKDLISCDGWIQREGKRGGTQMLWCQLLSMKLRYASQKHCTIEQFAECMRLFASSQLQTMGFWDGGKTDNQHGEKSDRSHAGSDESRTYEEGRFSDK